MTTSISLGERIARCLPGASFELEALVRLVGIEETSTVSTAAVSCGQRTRLLVNPAFVAEHCVRDEHLFLLVMHEMWHVLLGHTTLFPAVTPTHNFIFDAVINGLLCRMFPAREHTALFTEFYDARNFPMCLLRPPPGWPESDCCRATH